MLNCWAHMGLPVNDINSTGKTSRTIRSFDPCVSGTTHETY